MNYLVMAPFHLVSVISHKQHYWLTHSLFQILRHQDPPSDSLHIAMDSQVLGSLNSMSIPSEPPDIRNWFSSYVYESPDLNTLEGFRDFDGSAETSLDGEEKAKLSENGNVGVKEDGAGATGLANVIVECDKPDQFERIKPAAVVSGLSESVSLCSEPPDIKNWFSSYVYESPPLDTIEDFAISDYKEREDDRVYNDQRAYVEDCKDVSNFTDRTPLALPSHSVLSAVVSRCTNLVKDTEIDNQSMCKDGQNVVLKPNSPTLPQKTSERVFEQILPELIRQDQNHGLAEKFSNRNQLSEDCDARLSGRFIDRSHRSFNIENDSGIPDKKSLFMSTEKKDGVEDVIENEDLHEHVLPRTLDLVELGNSRRNPTAVYIGKENKDTELPENGFISTRKNNRQKNIGKTGATSGVRLESLRNQGKHEVNCDKDIKIRMKPLSETTNFHDLNVVESTGKWRCPQKYKPDLGPPLKQLRLEQWVRRL